MRPSTPPSMCTVVTAALVLFTAACSDAPSGPDAASAKRTQQITQQITPQVPTSTSQSGTTLAANAYFVAPNGSDGNAGTQDRPWRTIRYALTRLQAGQTLYVRGGTYTENIKSPSIRAGRPDARITVAAYPGERPVIAGLLWLSRPNYWTFDGINVTWAAGNPSSSHMVKLTNGIGWAYQNSEIWGARSFANVLVVGTVAGEPADWALRGNCVHDTYATNKSNQDHNLYINTGTSAGRGVIERNVLYNAPNGQNVKLGYGTADPKPGHGAANVTVRYNTMYKSLKPLLVADHSHHVTIERNIIVDGTDGYAIRAYRLTGSNNNVFRDNVLHGFKRLQYADAGHSTVPEGSGNLFPLDPRFDRVSCDGFRPGASEARAFGHLAGR